MRRTQLYLDDVLWDVLHVRSRETNVSMSELLRKAVRDKYLDEGEQHKQSLLKLVGLWKGRQDLPSTEDWIRRSRADSRSERLNLK